MVGTFVEWDGVDWFHVSGIEKNCELIILILLLVFLILVTIEDVAVIILIIHIIGGTIRPISLVNKILIDFICLTFLDHLLASVQ